MISFTVLCLLFVRCAIAQSAPGAQRCNSLWKSLTIADASLLAVDYLQQDTKFVLPGLSSSCTKAPNGTVIIPVNLCRVVFSYTTSPTSETLVEGWLPDEWNSRLLATGGSGIGGCVDYPRVQYAATFGFASFGTNGGHNGSVGSELFLNKPETIVDYGGRAIHVEALLGKIIVEKYYSTAASYNYYFGCSTGGRHGISTALRYADDFDGILAGAPGVRWLQLVGARGILARRTGWPDIESPNYLRQEQWQAVVKAQVELLDALDGVKNGVIDQPASHHLDPEVFRCGAGVLNDSVCLSGPQVQTVRATYEPITNARGEAVVPRWEYGCDTSAWTSIRSNNTPVSLLQIVEPVFQGIIYNDSAWTSNNFTVSDLDTAARLNPGRINTEGTDFSAFRNRGGKLIVFQGRVDEEAPSALAADSFSLARTTMNLSIEEMHEFYRLFFIPGMAHCSEGTGPVNIGETNIGYSIPALNTSQTNVLLALVDWTENQRAPDEIVGSELDTNKSILSQRRFCLYPQESVWNKQGDPKFSSSWKCQEI